jgi:hypothetical protein
LKRFEWHCCQAIPQVPTRLLRLDPLPTRGEHLRCFGAPQELRDCQRVWRSVNGGCPYRSQHNATEMVSCLNDTPRIRYQIRNPIQMPNVANNGRVVQYAIIQIDLSWQASQIIALTFYLIPMQGTIHDSDINTGLTQAQSKLTADDVPDEPLCEFDVELLTDIQVPHDNSIRRNLRLAPQATL